jgi:hypothetical protein
MGGMDWNGAQVREIDHGQGEEAYPIKTDRLQKPGNPFGIFPLIHIDLL